jgi:TonB family protein
LRISTLVVIGFLFVKNFYGQAPGNDADSLKRVMDIYSSDQQGGKGVDLILDHKYSEASSFFSDIIKQDESARDAYFKRGVAEWSQSDTNAACRDWSAVLALGDTATFLLLDSKCSGNMILGEDTLKSTRYRELFATTNPTTSVTATTRRGEKANVVADVMPEFPGGEAGLYSYLKNNLIHPSSENKKEGRVYVNFVISSKGRVMFPYIARGISPEYDAEALRLVRKMPLWKPAILKGKAVAVRYSVPVKFSLSR